MPSGERTPSATTSRSQDTSRRSPSRSKNTPATRSPSMRTSTARAPSIPWAPDLIAVVRRWSSSSVRATAEPYAGSAPPGQGSSRVCPNPWARRPWLTVWARTQSPSPSRSSSPMARGVSPSPQVLSRGNTAASASTTSSPARAAHAAVAEPAGPAPTTSTSVRSGVLVGWALVTPTFSQGVGGAGAGGVAFPGQPGIHVLLEAYNTRQLHGTLDESLGSQPPGGSEGAVVDRPDHRLLACVVVHHVLAPRVGGLRGSELGVP